VLDVSALGIDHVQLAAPAGCEPAARRFFGELLGLTEIEKPPALRSRGGCWFAAGQQQLHVGVSEAHTPALKAHPAIRYSPAGLEELAARLTAAGERVEWDDAIEDLRRFYTSDPWGNRIELLASGSSSAPLND
jgi:catechol 2,3-dioxygenase-like lactoylglutathione lyase family enzyme